jgi:hypothetical protein
VQVVVLVAVAHLQQLLVVQVILHQLLHLKVMVVVQAVLQHIVGLVVAAVVRAHLALVQARLLPLSVMLVLVEMG